MCEIICVTNRALCGEGFLVRLGRIAAAKPKAVILREKDMQPEEYRKLAVQAQMICSQYGVPCILHSFADIAAELGAENLILMTDIAGLLRDKDDPSTLIPAVNVSEVPYLKMQGIISGGMIPKIDCCVEAVRRGVNKTVIIDGRVPHSILIEILSNEGIGTQFT